MDEDARAALRGSTREALGLTPDAIAVMFSGKLSPRKGVDLLPEAVRRLPSALRDRIVLVFVGDGAQRGALEAAGRGPGAVAMRFAGVQRQAALSAYYHAADLLALPSISGETWGLVVNEALHHGVPCVVSDRVGSAPDLILAGTGVACDAASAEALSDALARGIRLTGDADVRRACRERAAGYSVDRAAQGIASAYRAVTAAPDVPVT
jgi:glycosyltransferase involved in cell wall biosynthesis